jgi:hypothetical protein
MKKLILLVAIALIGFNANAQDESTSNAKSEGNWLLEVNTGSWATGSTAFSLISVDGNTMWSAGAEAGYFVKENLAIKAGLGYSDFGEGSDGAFAYKVGAKYYVGGNIPVGVDFTGVSEGDYNASWVGLQAGYAIHVADNVAIEPTLRYNVTLDDMKADSSFQALIGFTLFF